LASNFSSDPNQPLGFPAAEQPAGADGNSPSDGGGAVDASGSSAAVMKFRSCRWRRPPEDGAECCTHRDVMPIAGTAGFKPEAWCPDCEYFKLRRSPRKRDPREDHHW
jgi:hypothetical protein